MNSSGIKRDSEKIPAIICSAAIFTIVFVIGATVELSDRFSIDTKLTVLIGVWIYAVFLGLYHIKTHFAYFVFVSLLFVFILSRPILATIYKLEWKYWKVETLNTAFAIIFTSIIALIIVQRLILILSSTIGLNKAVVIRNENSRVLQQYAFLLLLASSIPYYYIRFKTLLLYYGKEYASIYLQQDAFPFIIRATAGLFPMAVSFYLALIPSKRKTVFALLLYVMSGIPLFIVGNRAAFILPVVFAVVYYQMRAQIDTSNQVWITKTMVLGCIIIMSFSLVVLGAMNYTRDNKNASEEAKMPIAIDFFYRQGTTFDTICQGIEYRAEIEALPGDPIYTFSEALDYIKYSRIGRFFNNEEPIPGGNSLQAVYKKSSLAHRLSYIVYGPYYLSGHGRGSSYALENYLDWGLTGVFVFSFAIGLFLLNITTLIKKHSLIIRLITVTCLMNIFIIPRAESSVFTTFLCNPYFWILIITILFIIIVTDERIDKHI